VLHAPADAPAELLLAKDKDKDKDKEEKRKKKKEKNSEKRQSEKRQPEKRQSEKRQSEKRDSGKGDSGKRGKNNTGERTLTKEERERIYNRGLRDGKDKGYDKGVKSGFRDGKEKGYEKGVRSGYREGLDSGRNRNFQRGYDRGYERARRRYDDWDSDRWRVYNNQRRDIWRRPVVVNNYYGAGGWARRPGWYNYRPWGGGWYGGWSSSPPWGWWFGQSLVWGITTIATAAIINNSVNRAIERRQPTVLVPDSNWQLYYGSVQPVQDYGVTFAVYNGSGTYEMEADCNEGLLNGEVPSTPAEAQLINAACQVTFGSQV
jgi:hypothetical protein